MTWNCGCGVNLGCKDAPDVRIHYTGGEIIETKLTHAWEYRNDPDFSHEEIMATNTEAALGV